MIEYKYVSLVADTYLELLAALREHPDPAKIEITRMLHLNDTRYIATLIF